MSGCVAAASVGKAAVAISIPAVAPYSLVFTGGGCAALASLSFFSTGDFDTDETTSGCGNTNTDYSWMTPEGGAAGSAYNVKATTQGGTPGVGTMGSMLSLGGTLTWSRNRLQAAGMGQTVWTILFEIEKASNPGVIIASRSITLTAEIG